MIATSGKACVCQYMQLQQKIFSLSLLVFYLAGILGIVQFFCLFVLKQYTIEHPCQPS